MLKRTFAGLLAGVCVISNAVMLPESISAADSEYTMNVSVKLNGEKKRSVPTSTELTSTETSTI